MKKITFFEISEIPQKHALKSLYAFFYLNMVDKTQPILRGKSFMTILPFGFHCEILKINFTAFVKDILLFKNRTMASTKNE